MYLQLIIMSRFSVKIYAKQGILNADENARVLSKVYDLARYSKVIQKIG